jgi:hypothetical protein
LTVYIVTFGITASVKARLISFFLWTDTLLVYVFKEVSELWPETDIMLRFENLLTFNTVILVAGMEWLFNSRSNPICLQIVFIIPAKVFFPRTWLVYQ